MNQIHPDIFLKKKGLDDYLKNYVKKAKDKLQGKKITNDKCPSIDIPVGYFDKKIKIRYGYNDRKEDWVNINPLN